MNRLKVKDQQTIVTLYERGWAVRKIARELGLDRATVRRYIGAGAKFAHPANRLFGVKGFKITRGANRLMWQ